MASTTAKFLVISALLLSGSALAKDPQTPDDIARKRGFTVQGLQNVDVDGDGEVETVGVCRGKKGLRLCWFEVSEEGARWGGMSAWARGKKFKSLTKKTLLASVPGDELVFELYDETPDEKVKRVLVYAAQDGGPKEIFKSVIYRPKLKSERARWERSDVVKYGDARQGWYWIDLNNDGDLEAVVRRKAKLIGVPVEDGDQKILIGVNEEVFTFDKKKSRYIGKKGGRYTDFMPKLAIASVRGSSAFVPKETLKELEAEAISAQMAAVERGEEAKETKIDRKSFFAHAADGDLDTGWIEDDKGAGDGEWIEVELEEKSTVHMVRVVSGCTSSKRDFKSHNIPTRFQLRFDSGERTSVNLYEAKSPQRPAVGVILRPLKEKKFANQTLIFLSGSFETKKVRLTIEEVKKRGRRNRACISEISVH